MKANKFFTKEKVRGLLDGDICELIRGLGMRLNLFAQSVECGLAELNLLKDPAKLGFKDAATWSQQLAEAAECLNSANESEKTKQETKKKVVELLHVIGEMDESLLQSLSKMTDASARLCNFGVNVVSLKALTSELKHWAKMIPEHEKQIAAVRKFIKEPAEPNLTAALVEAVEEKAWRTLTRGRRRYPWRTLTPMAGGRQQTTAAASSDEQCPARSSK